MEIIHQEFYGNSILNWAIAVGILILSFVVVKMLYWIFSNVIRRLTSKTKTNLDDVLINKLENPLTYLILILGYWISIHYLVFKEEVEIVLENAAYFLLVLDVTAILSRIVDALISEVIMPITEKSESSFDNQLIPVIQKGVRSIIWVLGIIIGLDNIGFDITAMIAGLGIGGLVLALAAQDSVKNIFAGIMIFLDKPFRIKDRIQVDGFDGTVEEVGLRSTRLRTLEGRIVTIPNSRFTDNSVTNVTSQPTLKVKLNLGLTYDTDESKCRKLLIFLKIS